MPFSAAASTFLREPKWPCSCALSCAEASGAVQRRGGVLGRIRKDPFRTRSVYKNFFASRRKQPRLSGCELFLRDPAATFRAQQQEIVLQSRLDSNRPPRLQPLNTKVRAGHQLVPPISQPHGFSLMIGRSQTSDIQGVIQMQFAAAPKIIKSVGDVRIFLDFADRQPCPNRVNRPCRHIQKLPLPNLPPVE